MAAIAADRHLLLGLLALQNGLIHQAQLVAAFQAWTLEKSRPLADHLVALGHLSSAQRSVVEAMAALHLEAHGGEVEKSLAAVPAGKSTLESLAAVQDPDIERTLSQVGSARLAADDGDADRTASYAVGTATSDGQRFRVLRPHARGGLGAVFVALDAELHREVALKQILDQHADDPANRARFLLEAEITGGLEHPGIVPVYGLGTYAGGRPFYTMRFIKGDSLKDAIERFHGDATLKAEPGRRSLELRKLLRRFMDVCNAIDYAHSRGVLHRDIKPGNIIVGKHGETLVVDWGLAKATGKGEYGADERTLIPSSASGSAETLPGSALGTPAYMSPEQARGELDRLGSRSDVYSLGAMLYCLLTGRPPFEGEDIGEVLRQVQCGGFARPRQLDPALDEALEAVCLKAMATRGEDRYASCRELADDVERWAAGEPVSAWAEPWTRTLARWLARHRTGMTGAAAAVLAGVVGLVAVLAVQTQANGRLQRANSALATANEQINKVNSDLNSANEREKQRFDLAMGAIRLFLGEVGDDLVLKADQFKPLRDRMLRSAADFYGKLEGLLTDQPDRASREAMANAYYELGELTAKIGDKPAALAAHRNGLAVRRDLASGPADGAQALGDVAKSLSAVAALFDATGQPAEAIARYEESRDLLEGLPPSGPGSDGRRALLGTVYGEIGGILTATGRTAAAMSAYHHSLEILTRLADDNPSIAEFQRLLALAHNETAKLYQGTGKLAEAMEACRRTLSIRQKLADEYPAVTQFWNDLAGTHNNIGVLLWQTGKLDEALESYRKSLAIRQKLADENPAVTQFQSRLADSHFNIGILQRSAGRRPEALESYRRGQAIFQKLADQNPTVTEFRSSVGESHNNIGVVQREAGDLAEALESFRRALAIKQKLADENPAVVRLRSNLARNQYSIGELELAIGKPAKALEAYQVALAILQKVADDNPTVTLFRFDLTMMHIGLADVLRTLGRSAEAKEGYERAVAIGERLVKENPDVPQYRIGLATSLRQRGLLSPAAGAVADARRAAALYEGMPFRSGEEWYELACCHAALAGAAGRGGSGLSGNDGEDEAGKAMDLLRRAAAEGYRDTRVMEHEVALDPLRARADFHLLLMDLAMPTEPFAAAH